jgi:hypothetical protein
MSTLSAPTGEGRSASTMSQRSPGKRGDTCGKDHFTTKNLPKSTPNLLIHHPVHLTSTSKYHIYKNIEGFRWESCPKKWISRTAEVLEKVVLVSKLLGSEKMGRRESSPSRGRSSWDPSTSTGKVCSHGCGSAPEMQLVLCPRASYKVVLVGQSCTHYQREVHQP